MTHRISFEENGKRGGCVVLPAGSVLSERLDAESSPLLFGCRSGICGTCLIEVVSASGGALELPDEDERELLELIAPDRPLARLACRIALTADLVVRLPVE